MRYQDVLLVLIVVVVWGCNFLFIDVGLTEMPPLFLCTLRFFLASLPAIFFIKPPAASVKLIILYGFLMFDMQFGLLFLGMKAGMTPGLASLLNQTQIFFSLFFAAIFFGEIPSVMQMVGALISFSGIGLVAMHLQGNVTVLGFLLLIAASMFLGLGNLVTKKMKHVNMMALVVWGSFVAFFPLLLCSLLFEGPQLILQSFHHITWKGEGAILYIVYASTWVGYGLWNKLIGCYPIATIVPFTLLVPIVAIFSSVLVLGESLELWKVVAGFLVISGLCINILSGYFRFGRVKNQEIV